MATFRCSKCGCDEDTALCNYWSARVRDNLPVCSACDPKIGKWHRQFPQLFGVFLVTPRQPKRSRETLGSLVESLRLAEVECSRQGMKPDVTLYFNDLIPAYKPLTAQPMSATMSTIGTKVA